MRRLLVLLMLLVVPPASASELEAVSSYNGDGGAAEHEVAGDYAFLVGSQLDIVSIADPAKPRRVALIDCQNSDVALDPAAQILVVSADNTGGCVAGEGGFAV